MKFQDSCIHCGSKEDLYLDMLGVVHHPPDAYVGLLAGALISAVGAPLVHSITGGRPDYDILRAFSFIGLVAGFVYYSQRSTSVRYQVLFCVPCRKKYTNRNMLRIGLIITIVLISLVGSIVVSAVMKSDDYTYVPAVLGGMIGVVALCFRLFSKPRLVVMGNKESVISIPGLGHVQVDNSWSVD